MKKTLTINLANTVYHIDEDAYNKLQVYFENLRKHFSNEEDANEILTDIEARFSELFNERLKYGMQVITLKEVDETIGIMGNPNEFEDTTDHPDANGENSESNDEKTPQKKKRRLYRDIENQKIAGVAAGLAAYLNVDVTLIRVILLLLVLIGVGSIIPIYLILWIAIPEAHTSAQKLEMRGEEPTIENIKNFVKENVERVAEKAEKEIKAARERNFFQKAGDGLIEIIQAVAKVLMALIGGVFGLLGLIILLMLLASIAFVVPFLITGASSPFFPFGSNIYIEGYNIGNLAMYPQLMVSLLLFIGIPLGAIAYAIFQKIFNWRPTSKSTGWILVAIWLISFTLTMYYGIIYAHEIFVLNSTNL
ncbi:PspC domain-containing protein [Parabacteroides sp. FAFU027]|uniref:PspC domain-containing protein n=1 Tax=Parabacteroides sp. FAFU027 TaxID=2922715 RepID=UPI001FAFA91F|nr:PspC domain-containing protein [Parabacteroides sp. FAFU027]